MSLVLTLAVRGATLLGVRLVVLVRVVVALGVKTVTALADTLEGKVAELYTAGDCEEPRKLLEATYEGSLAARKV